MLVRYLKAGLYRLAPSLVESLSQYRKKRRRLRALISEARNLAKNAKQEGIQSAVEHIIASTVFHSSQQPQEINKLMEVLNEHQPHTVCEIGCYRGGTLFLLCQVAPPNATLISLDLSFDPQRIKAFHYFRRGRQRLSFLSGDSHGETTLNQLKHLLNGRQLDFLFIDGDHSYDGVKSDYEMYSPLVRPGGLIAFHDIVPDFETRYGIKTESYTGGVPEFWKELKHQNKVTHEFIQDPGQDGFGIGLIEHM